MVILYISNSWPTRTGTNVLCIFSFVIIGCQWKRWTFQTSWGLISTVCDFLDDDFILRSGSHLYLILLRHVQTSTNTLHAGGLVGETMRSQRITQGQGIWKKTLKWEDQSGDHTWLNCWLVEFLFLRGRYIMRLGFLFLRNWCTVRYSIVYTAWCLETSKGGVTVFPHEISQ